MTEATPPPEPNQTTTPAEAEPNGSATGLPRIIQTVTNVNVRITVLAIITALVIGAVLIALSDEQARTALGYVTSRPGDFFDASWTAIEEAYRALFRGAFSSNRALSESLTSAIPLVLVGLAVTIPLRAGMFNIGGEGQLIAGGLAAGFVGFAVTGVPTVIHLPLAVLAGLAAGAAYGWVPGILKSRTGAHEVITTIMLNNIAIFVAEYLLTTSRFQAPGRSDPVSRPVLDSAKLPRLLPADDLRIHAGLVIMVIAAIAAWVLIERSTTGMEIQAVGLNPHAATSAGMSVGRVTVLALAVGGLMAGLGGTGQVLGLNHRLSTGFSGGLGFDGITVALLGRGRVGGTVAAGLLFGALRAGGRTMQAQSGTSLDLVTVIQALIIVFIAAPALIRALYRIRAESTGTVEVSSGWTS